MKSAKEKEEGFLSVLFELFRSLKLTIFLLILLAILSVVGTVITQNAARADYIERYGAGLYEVLDFFSLFDMYHSWWFSAILLLLVTNLVACSLNRLPGIWSQISRGGSGELEDSTLRILPFVEKTRVSRPIGAKAEEDILVSMKRWFKNPVRTESESAITLFVEKGKYCRLGVPIVHLSILIILVGGLMGSLYGFKGFVNIPEGETTDRIYLRVKDEEVPKPIGFSVRCDDFKVTFYDLPGREKRRMPKEYTSILTILEGGKEVMKKTIQVNHPLHYKGLAFYQSSYGSLHDITVGVQRRDRKEKTLFRGMEGETVPIPGSSASIRILRYSHEVQNFGEGVQVALFRPNQEPQAFWLLKNFPMFDEQRRDEFIFSFVAVAEKEYTGLQVTKDPGVWVVWIGCGLMILGLIVSFFFSHQRVWVRIPKGPKGEIVLAGSANRNRIGFEKTFGQLAEAVRSKAQ
jgi:cytochrome c biogenesis protein